MAHGKHRTISATLNETVSLLSCGTSLHCKRETLVARKDTTETCTEQELCNDIFKPLTYLKGLFGTNSTLEWIPCCAASWQPGP